MKTKSIKNIREELQMKEAIVEVVDQMISSREYHINYLSECLNNAEEKLKNDVTEEQRTYYLYDIETYKRELEAEEKVKSYLLEMF